LEEGQIVLISLPGQPRSHWPKGRVTKLIYGRDKDETGQPYVRAAYVKNYFPKMIDWKLKKKLLGTKGKRKQLSAAERLWITGSQSQEAVRYPVQLLIPLEMHGVTGKVPDLPPSFDKLPIAGSYCNELELGRL